VVNKNLQVILHVLGFLPASAARGTCHQHCPYVWSRFMAV